MKVCVLVLFQWIFQDEISFETKQKSKYKVDFDLIFISIKKKTILETSEIPPSLKTKIFVKATFSFVYKSW